MSISAKLPFVVSSVRPVSVDWRISPTPGRPVAGRWRSSFARLVAVGCYCDGHDGMMKKRNGMSCQG